MNKHFATQLHRNFKKIVLECLFQFTFGYAAITTTNFISPFAMNVQDVQTLVLALPVAASFSFALLTRAIWSQKGRQELRERVTDIVHKCKPNILARAIASRLAHGIKLGALLGISDLALRYAVVALSAPESPQITQLIQDGNTLLKTVPRIHMAIHAPVLEEVYFRTLLMNIYKLTAHATIVGLNTFENVWYVRPTDARIDTTAQQATGGPVDESETKARQHITALNNYVDQVCNFSAAVLFAYVHLPSQRPTTFLKGMCWGSLSNQYKDPIANVASHLTNNLLAMGLFEARNKIRLAQA